MKIKLSTQINANSILYKHLNKAFGSYIYHRTTAFCTNPLHMLSIGKDKSTPLKSVVNTECKKLDELTFSNRCVNSLPLDPILENYTRQVHDACFSKVYPSALINPQLISFSLPALSLIDLGENEAAKPEFAEYLSGNKILNGSSSFAHCYCGHQFGSFAGQLGDGAAIYLGEIQNSKGEHWEIQLKGAGKTPYSRSADGRKVLRSSIREFLCSEHMHALGIPTTRAATLISSDSLVIRDQFYDGHAKNERCAVVCRFSPTFIRFGSFEIFKEKDHRTALQGPSAGNIKLLKELSWFVIKNYYHELLTHDLTGNSIENDLKNSVVKEFLQQVIHRTARLVAKWQCLGWCHGVLNTDNLSIIGLTIDYGPFGFMEHYTPHLIPNTTDELGRYRFEAQPDICKWNCWKLCEIFYPLVPPSIYQTILDEFDDIYNQEYYKIMKEKLGFIITDNLEDNEIIKALITVIEEVGADWTNTFRDLNLMKVNLFQKQSRPNEAETEEVYKDVLNSMIKYFPSLDQLRNLTRPNLAPTALFQYTLLWRTQPELLRSFGIDEEFLQRAKAQQERYIALQKISPHEKLEGDLRVLNEWLKFYTLRLWEDFVEFSGNSDEYMTLRTRKMNKFNPKIILRNHLAQKAIEEAEKGDYNELNRLLKALLRPYDEDHNETDLLPLGGKNNFHIRLS